MLQDGDGSEEGVALPLIELPYEVGKDARALGADPGQQLARLFGCLYPPRPFVLRVRPCFQVAGVFELWDKARDHRRVEAAKRSEVGHPGRTSVLGYDEHVDLG